jgi:hypothetical protein
MSKCCRNAILAGGAVTFALIVTGSMAMAEDDPPAASPKVEMPRSKARESDPRLDMVPISVLMRLAHGSAPTAVLPNRPPESPLLSGDLAITDKQRSELMRLVHAHNRWSAAFGQARQGILGKPYPGLTAEPQTFVIAFETLARRQWRQLGDSLAALLTPEQLAFLRRRFRAAGRDEILRAETPRIQNREMDAIRIEDQSNVGDMLSLLLVGTVQDRLEITDEQYLSLCDLRDRSVSAAILVVEAGIAETEMVGSVNPESVFDELPELLADGKALAPALRLLSKDRQAAFAGFLDTLTPEQRRALISGYNARVSRGRGAVEFDIELSNPVENSNELLDALALTKEQRIEFAYAIQVEEDRIQQLLARRLLARVEKSRQAAERGAEWRKAFIEEWNAKALRLLNSDQLAKLKDQKWCALGVMSLLDPEYANRLNLSDKQRAEIRSHLTTNRPAVSFGNQLPQSGETAEEYRRRLAREDENRAAYVSSVVAMQQAALKVLTVEQRAKLLETTRSSSLPELVEPPVPFIEENRKPGTL